MSSREALDHIILRKDHAVCTRCATIEPIHLGDGTPAPSFISAVLLMGARHRDCKHRSGVKIVPR